LLRLDLIYEQRTTKKLDWTSLMVLLEYAAQQNQSTAMVILLNSKKGLHYYVAATPLTLIASVNWAA